LENVRLHTGDASQGWDTATSYDIICITSSFYRLPESYLEQLTIGGRLFCITGLEPAMQAKVVTRFGEREWQTEIIYETVVPVTINSELPPAFEF
jgi:protein-L-isoaspartate(D-aspartate) O-methyltransferase